MAKRTGFDVDAEGRIDRSRPDPGPSRASLKLQDQALEVLAQALVAAAPAVTDNLPLDESLHTALRHARSITRAAARQRQVRFVTKLLRGHDVHALDAAMRAGHDDGERNVALRALERWRTRLATEGDGALQAFLDEHPGCDRQRVRQAVRSASRSPEPGSKAMKQLFQVLKAEALPS